MPTSTLSASHSVPTSPDILQPVQLWGLPLAPLTMDGVIDVVDEYIESGRPRFLITANLNYAMLTEEHPRLAEANKAAALVLADGMPLVWASRLIGQPLPERVTGSDLFPALCERAAETGYRVYLMGGAEGVAEQAAENLKARFPGLNIVGIESPPYRNLTVQETDELIDRVRAVAPDLLFLATSQPKGEVWLLDHHQRLGVPVSIQVGASIDFIAGRVGRAPGWVGKVGLEWAFRILMEPRRLGGRYVRNAKFLVRMIVRGTRERFSTKGHTFAEA